MNKSLFTEDFTFTPEASELERKTTSLLRPLFKEYVALGYSPREISHVMMMVCSLEECVNVLNRHKRV